VLLDINKNQFKLHNVIGKGGFGKVWKVERKKFKTMYAMKEMSKARIVSKKSVSSVLNERKLLAQLKHPYANLSLTFF
jgi:serine/threonine protein kinase